MYRSAIALMLLAMVTTANSAECIISKKTYETHMLAGKHRVIGEFDKSLVGAFLEEFNSVPPETKFKADAITTYEGASTGFVNVVLYLKGCLVEDAQMSQKGFDEIMEGVLHSGTKL